MRVRRRRVCVLEVADRDAVDFAALLGGEVVTRREAEATLICPLGGDRIALAPAELTWLATLTTDWCEVAQADREMAAALVARGAVIGDGAESSALAAADARLDAIGWHGVAAAYQAATRWSGVEGDETKRPHTDEAHAARLSAVVDKHGWPPPHFPARDDAIARVTLPVPPFDDAFARVLKARRTTRHYDTAAILPLAAFNRVLYGTYGAQGTRELAPGVIATKRTSASGGGLHPMDAYPIVMRVEGLEPGLYHYDGGLHRLELLERLDPAAARKLATDASIGQAYFAEAHACVLQVARFERNYWKYRNHAKALKAVLLDAGHLSQTFYLLATEMALGAFYTAAINDADINARLGLDPLVAGAIGMHGIGLVDPGRDELHFRAAPYLPPR